MRLITDKMRYEAKDWSELMRWLEFEVKSMENERLWQKRKQFAAHPAVFAAVETAVLLLLK